MGQLVVSGRMLPRLKPVHLVDVLADAPDSFGEILLVFERLVEEALNLLLKREVHHGRAGSDWLIIMRACKL